jgi:uncharacterized protein (DUF488 family)
MSNVYPIGYEASDIETFVATRRAAGVQCLADVRAIALSRKKGFSKKALSARLAQAGIQYVHFVGLGDPKPGREAARAGDYQKFRDIYASHLESDDARGLLEEVIVLARLRATCLFCFERDPQVCHRSIVASEMSETGFDVLNLFNDRPGRHVGNASRVSRRYPRQGTATA